MNPDIDLHNTLLLASVSREPRLVGRSGRGSSRRNCFSRLATSRTEGAGLRSTRSCSVDSSNLGEEVNYRTDITPLNVHSYDRRFEIAESQHG